MRYLARLSAILLGLLAVSMSACQLAAPTPTAPTPAATAEGADLSDALMLYSSDARRLSDYGFERITSYYGLKLAALDLTSANLTDAMLRDEAGRYYPTVHIDAQTLNERLDGYEIQALEQAIDAGGLNLLVSALRQEQSYGVRELTDGEVVGSKQPRDRQRDYLITTEAPEITRELSGQTVAYNAEQLDYGLLLAAEAPHVQVLVQFTDDRANFQPLFARYQNGAGGVFVLSNHLDATLKYNRLEWHYTAARAGDSYEQQWFANLIPMMMFVRYAGGDEAWHRDQDYANLTLDDPPLTEAAFDYASILKEAIVHDFHVTIAMPPVYYQESEPTVVELFTAYPDRLSVVMHGNNHDGYEFYKYESEAGDEYPAQPIELQEQKIVEARTRMEAFARRTGLPYAPIMIFPYNIAPAETLKLLKEYGFQGTINSMDVPLGVERANAWDSYMYPAELAYNGFAVMARAGVRSRPYAFDLFIERPILLYTHRDFFEADGIGAFTSIAETINGLEGEAQWRSLDYIMRRLSLQKRNDDGSVELMAFGSRIVVTNDGDHEQLYHLRRRDDLQVPVGEVTVDGEPADYRAADGAIVITLAVPPQSSREVHIVYGAAERDYAPVASEIFVDYDQGLASVQALVRNSGAAAGPVSVELFDGDPAQGAPSLGIATTERIAPGAAATVKLTVEQLRQGRICVVADPYDVVYETDESNNSVCAEE